MSLSLNTLHRDGQFNFFSNLIEISRYSGASAPQIEKSLLDGINKSSTKYDMEATCLLMHEATHFLDMTTTLWGLEFTRRKHLFLENYINGDVYTTFNINASEVMLHSELSIIHEKTNLLDCTLHHSYEYHPHHGAYVHIHFADSKKIFCSIPLSMLSVLEANALATEILVEYRYIEIQYLGHQQHEAKQKLKRKVEKILNDYEQSEYSLFFILIKKHFDFLDIKNLALFTQHFIRFTLNLASISLAQMMGPIFSAIKNKEFGASVCEDFGRGASRHVFGLYLIFIIHNNLESKTITKEMIIELLDSEANDPIDLIISAINPDKTFLSSKFNDIEFEATSEAILENKSAYDYAIISNSINNNTGLIKQKPIGLHEISELFLTDFILEDGTLVSAPSRINVDVWQYFDDSIANLNHFDRAFKNEQVKKPHPMIGQGPVSQLLLNPEQAEQIMHDNDYHLLKKKGLI